MVPDLPRQGSFTMYLPNYAIFNALAMLFRGTLIFCPCMIDQPLMHMPGSYIGTYVY